MRKITVDTSRYTNVHGKSPRGYGLWYFIIQANERVETFGFTGTYTGAKSAAVARARELTSGYGLVLVES